MKKKKSSRTPAQKLARKKGAFRFFTHLVIGAVKVWLHGQPYIVHADDVEAFLQSEIERMKK